MIDINCLKTVGFSDEDISLIIKHDSVYGSKIEKLADEYAKTLGREPFTPYDTEEKRELAHQRGQKYIENIVKINPEHNYMLQLLAWLNLTPYLQRRYDELGIDRSIFYSTVKDILYKAEECKTMHGVCGVFVDYFFLNFDVKLFEIGRLQYEVYRFPHTQYTYGDYTLKKDDKIYSCHIPSSGKLTVESCMDSFQKAYEFFKSDLKGSILPVWCQSWLLYEPYVNQVFPKGSNMWQFARLFDIYDLLERTEFSDFWRVFGKNYEGTTKGLPTDNTLRRNFAEYIKKGGTFGYGSGVILYDGENRKIINK